MHTFDQFLSIVLYFLTRFVPHATPRQIARLTGVDQVEVNRFLARLCDEGLIEFGHLSAPPPVEFFGDPIYQGPQSGKNTNSSPEYFAHLVSKIRANTPESPAHKPMKTVSATSKGANISGGYFPPHFDDPANDIGRRLNIASLVAIAHERSLYDPRPEEFPGEPMIPAPIVILPPELRGSVPVGPTGPIAAPSPRTPPAPSGPTPPRLDRSPFLERPTAVIEPRPCYGLMSSFGRYGHLWLGAPVLKICGLSIGEFTPDLAVVIKGKIQHAAVLVIGWKPAKVLAFDRACRANGVSYELYAHPPKAKQ